MQVVIPDIISGSQSAFIKGRRITDNILIANELVRNFHLSSGAAKACLKVDLRKAYDSVNRQFLFHTLKCLGFIETWILWIKACIGDPMVSILVNGSPVGFFQSQRGLRQGDPLAPYLFAIIMEAFIVLLEKAMIKGAFRSMKLGVSIQISNFFFADDLLVFSKGDLQSLAAIQQVFQEFEALSGLSISQEKKSKLDFHRACTCKASICQRLGIE